MDFAAFWHYGMADGEDNVIHNSKKRGMVALDTEADFAEAKAVAVSEITSANPRSALEKAKACLNVSYNLLSRNCEHCVRLAHGLDVESVQLQRYLLVAVGTGIAMRAGHPAVKAAGGAAALTALLLESEESPVENAVLVGLLALGLVALMSG